MVDGDSGDNMSKREIVLEFIGSLVVFSLPILAFWVKYVFFD